MDPITIVSLLGKIGAALLDEFGDPDIRAIAGELIDKGNDLTAMIANEAALDRINEDLTAHATYPVISGLAGVPFVAFREELTGPMDQRLYVKTFP